MQNKPLNSNVNMVHFLKGTCNTDQNDTQKDYVTFIGIQNDKWAHGLGII